MKLGKLAPKPVKLNKKLQLKTELLTNYLAAAALPAPPATVDYSLAVAQNAWGIMGNDKYADCVCAAAGHMIQEWTANTGSPIIPTDSDVLAAYQHFVGDPNANPNQGINMQDFLIYWEGIGLGSDIIAAYAPIDFSNNVNVQNSVYWFGNCYIGLALPDICLPKNNNPSTWTKWTDAIASDPNNQPNSSNGHSVPIMGYDQYNLYVVTWGSYWLMSWKFYNTYVDESYAVLSTDWINKKIQAAPQGLDWTALQQDLNAITSGPTPVGGLAGASRKV